MMKAMLRSHDGNFGTRAAIFAVPLTVLAALALDHVALSPRQDEIRRAADQATVIAAASGTTSPQMLALFIRQALDRRLAPELAQRVELDRVETDGRGRLRVHVSARLPSFLARLFRHDSVTVRLVSQTPLQEPWRASPIASNGAHRIARLYLSD